MKPLARFSLISLSLNRSRTTAFEMLPFVSEMLPFVPAHPGRTCLAGPYVPIESRSFSQLRIETAPWMLEKRGHRA